jgi:hypothetical protein
MQKVLDPQDLTLGLHAIGSLVKLGLARRAKRAGKFVLWPALVAVQIAMSEIACARPRIVCGNLAPSPDRPSAFGGLSHGIRKALGDRGAHAPKRQST